ncbi:unnamed protein product [Acanthosepion pharaonis]|uniref:Uncharacterized protein n=1 Tax=Acanthosepion pharaonis TaxID=158019 RepID=A0A812EGM2_ACAPH|nr:unnamed protein product [Sepia pharaonis]
MYISFSLSFSLRFICSFSRPAHYRFFHFPSFLCSIAPSAVVIFLVFPSLVSRLCLCSFSLSLLNWFPCFLPLHFLFRFLALALYLFASPSLYFPSQFLLLFPSSFPLSLFFFLSLVFPFPFLCSLTSFRHTFLFVDLFIFSLKYLILSFLSYFLAFISNHFLLFIIFPTFLVKQLALTISLLFTFIFFCIHLAFFFFVCHSSPRHILSVSSSTQFIALICLHHRQ